MQMTPKKIGRYFIIFICGLSLAAGLRDIIWTVCRYCVPIMIRSRM